MMHGGEQDIERGIRKIYEVVLSTKNISARYIVVLALASLWVDAYDFTAFSFATASFKNTFPWMSPLMFGFAVASVQLGGVIGSIIGGWLTDRVGRRAMFITLMLLLTVAAIGAGLAPDPYTFSVFRTLLGFGIGADTATGFTYIFEYLEAKQRIAWSNLWQFIAASIYLITLGILVYPFYLIVHNLTNPLLWRLVMILGGIFAFIIFIFRTRIPESIMWLAYRGKLATAKQLLRKTYGIDLPDVPDIDVELRRVGWKGVFGIFRKDRWKDLVYSFNALFLSSFDFYPFVWFLPYILLTLKLAGPLATIEASAIIYAVGTFGGWLTFYLTPRLGTKTQYVFATAGSGLSLIFAALAFHFKLVWLLVLFAALVLFFHIIYINQGMTTISAVYPPKERGTAAGWGYFWVKFGAVIALTWAPTWYSVIGLEGLLYSIGTWALITSIIGLLIGRNVYGYAVELEE